MGKTELEGTLLIRAQSCGHSHGSNKVSPAWTFGHLPVVIWLEHSWDFFTILDPSTPKYGPQNCSSSRITRDLMRNPKSHQRLR